MAEETRLGGVYVDVRARTAQFVKGFTGADKRLKAHHRQLRQNRRSWRAARRELRDLGRQTTSIRNVGVAGAAAAAGLALLVRSQARYADELRTNARLTDQSVGSLQVWTTALASARSDQDSVADAMRELSLRIREAIDGNLDVAHAARLAGLQLTDEAGRARDVRDVLQDLAEIIPRLSRGAGISVLDRLGGEDVQLLYGILAEGSGKLNRRLAEARRTVRHLTDEQADALVELGEQLDRLEVAARAALGSALAENAERVERLLASIEDRMPSLIDGFLGFTEAGVKGLDLLLERGRELLAILAAVRGGTAGAAAGAAVGSLFGPAGTAIGTVAGGLLGAGGAGAGVYGALGGFRSAAGAGGGVAPFSGQGSRAHPFYFPGSTVTGRRLSGSGPDRGGAGAAGGAGGGLLYTSEQAAAARAAGQQAGQEYVTGLLTEIRDRRQDLRVALGEAVAVPEELRDLDRHREALAGDLARVRAEVAGLSEDTDEAIKRKAELVLQARSLVEELEQVAAARGLVVDALEAEEVLSGRLAEQQTEAEARQRQFLQDREAAYERYETAVRNQQQALAQQRETVRQVAFAFSDFIGQSIQGVDSLSDRVAALADQIAHLLTQRLLVEPLVESLVQSLGGGSGGGGGTILNYSPTFNGGFDAAASGAAYNEFQAGFARDLARPSALARLT